MMTGRKLFAGFLITLAMAGAIFSAGPASAAPAAVTPTLNVSSTSVLPNQGIAVTGEGFTSGNGVTVASVSLGGASVSSDKVNGGSAVAVDSQGKLVFNLIIPINSTTLAAGGLTLSVTDSAGISASVGLSIAAPSITVSPTSSRGGTEIIITGANFPLDSSRAGADQVSPIDLQYQVIGQNPRRLGSVFPDAGGAFIATVKLPFNIIAPSDDNVVSATATGAALSATATHSVPAPSITVTPANGLPGARITISGVNFRGFLPLVSLSIGGANVLPATSAATDASGNFSVTVTAPRTDPGAQPVTARLGDTTSITSFIVDQGEVVPPPPFSVPAATGLRPLGDNLQRLFRFDNGTKKWDFYDPAPEFSGINTVTKLFPGEIYWLWVAEDQTATLNLKERSLVAGWNIIPW